MSYFEFNTHFFTGLDEVDSQHQHLVDLINTFSDSATSVEKTKSDLELLFQELAKYAQYHFQEEENLMQKTKVDFRHYNTHIEEHQTFLEDVTSMHNEMGYKNGKLSKQLLEFLTHWLAYHILGSDKKLGKQIKKIKSGTDPAEAFDMVEKELDSSTEPLLIAINGLFQIVSTRNKQLKKMNESLEEKVNERTKELSKANNKLRRISLTDALTNLPNRRHALQQLKIHWEESTQSEQPICLIMIDADHFKEVNDKYGHDAGDIVLCEVAKTFQHSVRTDDLVCRLGGDEFLIICPETDGPGGLHIAEIVKKNVSQMKVPTGDGYWHGSVSIGVAVKNKLMEDFNDLIKDADDGVYAAKRAGKNCVRTSDS